MSAGANTTNTTNTAGNAVGTVMEGPRLVLASASRTRQRLLAQAGLVFTAVPANLDEAAIRTTLRAAGRSTEDAVVALAEAKALAVAKANGADTAETATIVIGSDQILECGGRWYEKPSDLNAARKVLESLRDRDHRLVSAVAAVEGGRPVWSHVDVAVMTMRPFSPIFLDRYLASAGTDALDTVAAYRFEGPGVQLFSAVCGDTFTILGLPLLPLLDFLRRRGAVAD